jgi:hypothetical protein
VDVDLQFRNPSQRLDDRHPIRQIRHEMTIHDIQMENLDAGFLKQFHLALKICEIAKEQRG